MAYTLMIADDDAMIRKGLSCLIPWEELGFRLSGVFADGKTLLEHLRAGAADAVLTDIRISKHYYDSRHHNDPHRWVLYRKHDHRYGKGPD